MKPKLVWLSRLFFLSSPSNRASARGGPREHMDPREIHHCPRTDAAEAPWVFIPPPKMDPVKSPDAELDGSNSASPLIRRCDVLHMAWSAGMVAEANTLAPGVVKALVTASSSLLT